MLAILVVAGFLVRFTVADRFLRLSVLYYALPWPVLAAFSGMLSWQTKLRWGRMAWLSAGVGAFASWIMHSWQWPPVSSEPAGLRIALWNVSRPGWRLDRVVRELRARDSDVIALSEALPRHQNSVQRWQEAFPEYQAAYFERGDMLLLVRGTITGQKGGKLSPHSSYGGIHADVKGHAFGVVHVDLDASIGGDRSLPFPPLVDVLIDSFPDCMFVLGDFNTPRDSTHFDILRHAGWQHTFEASGRGYADTWPMPLPVLSLDQIWTRLRPLRCTHGVTALSDHRPVFADVAWK